MDQRREVGWRSMHYLPIVLEQFLQNVASQNNVKCLLSRSLCGSFRSDWAGCFWLGVAHEIAVEIPAGAASSEGLTGAGGLTSKMADSRDWWAGGGCWQEASVLKIGSLSKGLLEGPPDMAAGFPRDSDSRASRTELQSFLWPSFRSDSSYFYNVLVVTQPYMDLRGII